MLVSGHCRQALARWLNAVERRRRWPVEVREVTELALGKKTGGCRLIGLTHHVYRILARARYRDIRMAIESRVKRPFFADAPGRGAESAVFDAAVEGEVAAARSEHSAMGLVDLKSDYEHVEVVPMARGALYTGIPRALVVLAVHVNIGPRRIEVRSAWCQRAYPTRGILAGCTCATLFIRVHLIAPIEAFQERARRFGAEWSVEVTLVMYIDDGELSSIGACTEFLQLPLSTTKLQCDCSSVRLTRLVAPGMKALGFAVPAVVENLGIDFAAGRRLTKRPVQRRRLANAAVPKHRIDWWRKKGGAGTAAQVARGGIAPSITFGASVVGLSPAAMLSLRRTVSAGAPTGDQGSRR